MKVVYSKFTRERVPRFQIETSILEDERGIKTVHKRSLNLHGRKHIKNIYENYLRFSEKGRGYFLECEHYGNEVVFPYVKGESIYAALVRALGQRDKEKFSRLLQQYLQIVAESVYEEEEYKEEPLFIEIFGKHLFPQQTKATRYMDVDITFDNIIINEDNQIKIFDYEWMFECLVPINFAVYRAAFAFYLKHGGQLHSIMTEDEFYEYLGIKHEEKEIYRKMNDSMMSFIMSDDSSYNNYKKRVRFLSEFIKDSEVFTQVYFDNGEGYSEKESIIYPIKKSELSAKIQINLREYQNLRYVRIDPLNVPCAIQMKEIYAITEFGEETILLSALSSNAEDVYMGQMDFLGEDPQIIIEIKQDELWKSIVVNFEILFYREDNRISQYGNIDDAVKLLERENEMFLKREYGYRNREEEYRANLASAVSELERLKEINRLLRDKLEYIEGTSAYRLMLKGKIDKMTVWNKLQKEKE